MNQRWPDGLKERIEAQVGRSRVTSFTVEALEAALGNRVGLPVLAGEEAVRDSGRAPVSPRASEYAPEEHLTPEVVVGVRKVSAELDALVASRSCSRCGVPIKSPSLTRHPSCGGKIVPEPV